MISILIADDHPIIGLGIRDVLQKQVDIKIAGEIYCTNGIIELVRSLQPDVIILDSQLSGCDTFEIVYEIKRDNQSGEVLLFSNLKDNNKLIRFFQAGARGYVSKQEAPDVLVEAIRVVAKGNSFFSQDTSQLFASFLRTLEPFGTLHLKLTRQEIRVLAIASLGSSNYEIAQTLSITERTVEFHMSNILSKFKVKNRLEAIMKAKELGMII